MPLPTISIKEADLRQALLVWLGALTAGEVVAGQDNRVAMPSGTFIVLQTLRTVGLSTNKESWDFVNLTVANSRDTEWVCQLDFYGPTAADDATLVATLVRTQYACDQFALSGLDMAPLYADDPRQTSMINGEEQYQQRYTFDFHAQFNPVVTTPGQFASTLQITPVDVDVRFPPET